MTNARVIKTAIGGTKKYCAQACQSDRDSREAAELMDGLKDIVTAFKGTVYEECNPDASCCHVEDQRSGGIQWAGWKPHSVELEGVMSEKVSVHTRCSSHQNAHQPKGRNAREEHVEHLYTADDFDVYSQPRVRVRVRLSTSVLVDSPDWEHLCGLQNEN